MQNQIVIPPDTGKVLWFEFLLNSELLFTHLEKLSSDPSPVELITKFYDVITANSYIRNDVDGCTDVNSVSRDNLNDNKKDIARNVALKILSLKVASYHKWNLHLIRSLPFKTQIRLLQDLLSLTSNSNETCCMPFYNSIPVTDQSPQHLFAVLLYNRWVLSLALSKLLSPNSLTFGAVNAILYQRNDEELSICTDEHIAQTIDFLSDSFNWKCTPSMITFESLVPPSDSQAAELRWEYNIPLPEDELCSQIAYDLGTFFFHHEQYDKALTFFRKCTVDTGSSGFLTFPPSIRNTYLEILSGTGEQSLIEQLYESVVKHYKGVTNVLQADNIRRDIPLSYRITLELDIQGAEASCMFTVAKDLLAQLRALNLIRAILDVSPVYHFNVLHFTHNNPGMDAFSWAMRATWQCGELISVSSKKSLRVFIEQYKIPRLYSLVNIDNKNDSRKKTDCISNSIEEGEQNDESKIIDTSLHDFGKVTTLQINVRRLKYSLGESYSVREIHDHLGKLSSCGCAQSVLSEMTWEVENIAGNIVMLNVKPCFHRDFGYVVLGKVTELLRKQKWERCLEMLVVIDKDLENRVDDSDLQCVARLVRWEMLLVQMAQVQFEFPVWRAAIDRTALGDACEVCLATVTEGPRQEIRDQCAITLINLGRWESFLGLEKRWQYGDICAAVALACKELHAMRMSKYSSNTVRIKFSKNLWDIVLPIFTYHNYNTSSTLMPPSSGGGSNSNLSSNITATSGKRQQSSNFYDRMEYRMSNLRNVVLAIFRSLRDNTALLVVISLLVKLNNILRDESQLEIQADYSSMWPAVVSNANSYELKAVNDTLVEMTSLALHYYPNNMIWMRILAEIAFVNDDHSCAMKLYLKTLLIQSDYFSIPLQSDDHLFKRMIRCCMALNTNTHAAILCQYLDETDYTTAFKTLQENKNCADATDVHYNCLWDISILEYLIHLHHKRGEYQKRRIAIHVLGQLELNANNNEEIQREAINLRKTTFLRSLCHEYVVR